MRRSLFPITIVAMAVLLLVVACSPAATAPASTPAPAGQQPAPGASNAGDLTLGFSMPELQGSFWISMYYGIQDEAQKQGVELVALNAGGFDRLDRQIQQMQDLIQRDVDAILVGATSAQGVVPVVDEAKAKGIPLVAVGSIPASDKLDSIILADHFGMGKLQGEFMGEQLGGKGKVLIMAGPPGTNWAIDRSNGFKEALKEFPDIEIAAEQWTPTGRATGLKLMEDWLQTFPDVAGVYTAVDDLGAGAVDALKAVNKAGEVVVTSSNLSPIGEQYLREGFIHGETVQQIVLQGRMGVEQAINAASSEPVEEKIITPVLLITKENVDSMDYSPIQAPKDFRPSL